jgi:hypothetical protein
VLCNYILYIGASQVLIWESPKCRNGRMSHDVTEFEKIRECSAYKMPVKFYIGASGIWRMMDRYYYGTMLYM